MGKITSAAWYILAFLGAIVIIYAGRVPAFSQVVSLVEMPLHLVPVTRFESLQPLRSHRSSMFLLWPAFFHLADG